MYFAIDLHTLGVQVGAQSVGFEARQAGMKGNLLQHHDSPPSSPEGGIAG